VSCKSVTNSTKFIGTLNNFVYRSNNHSKYTMFKYYDCCFNSVGASHITCGPFYNNRVCLMSYNKSCISNWRLSRYSLKSYQPKIIGLIKAEW
jgi:hypothetical protein